MKKTFKNQSTRQIKPEKKVMAARYDSEPLSSWIQSDRISTGDSFKTISAALEWLTRHDVCRGPYGLHRMEFLMERLGNPQRDIAAILVGGTNGKGSVTALLENITSVGRIYQVGSTISPHLIDVTERIRLDARPLPDDLWIAGVNALKDHVTLMGREPSIGAPSFFELVTALAFWAWHETDRDLAVIEVGLGGRLDATNVTWPEISVITNIGTDHKELLGPDRPSIAREKLGIVKRKNTLITGEKDPDILRLFSETCDAQSATLVKTGVGDGRFEVIESHARGHRIMIPGYPDPVDFSLAGLHQLDNLATAMGVVEKLRQNGFDLPPDHVAAGISRTVWPGRLQWIDGNPPVLLDGAHNDEGLASLIAYLERFPMPRPAHLIFGVLHNKPAAAMARSLAPHFDSISYVSPKSGRALMRADFDSVIAPTDPRWKWCESLAEALTAGTDAGSASILVTGSLYLIADFLRRRQKKS
ncbi:MAG: bifunctional folylpolyglutamate synthase/dihydrofolate synthase [Candidatus Riflebacteria bacterium]|nr:bifunctional folylpolyglutamate synthase/dihydrofolate synthase [Candidatus Riflebacteria bacterium]